MPGVRSIRVTAVNVGPIPRFPGNSRQHSLLGSSTCKNAARWASRVKKWGNALPHLCPVNSADTSDDHILDHPGVDAGALHQRGERVGEPVDRMDAGEGAAQSPLDEGVRIASMMPASDLTTSFTGDPRRQLLPRRRWR